MATQENRSMVSETSICNQALSWLASVQITSLDQDSKEARWMKANYPFIRDAVLEERMWTFATARAKSVVADLDEWDEFYVHPKPTDWISVFRVFKDQVQNRLDTDMTWRMEGGNVLSKYARLRFWGMKRVTDTGAFSPLFVQALAARLAADAAVPLTENRQLQVDLWGLYGDKLREAAVRDGQQGGNDMITQGTLTGVRYSGGGIDGIA